MRHAVPSLLFLLAAGCADAASVGGHASLQAIEVPGFDGSDYTNEEDMIAHGRRLSEEILDCNSCHLADYSGADFGAFIPLLDGLWATNISRTLPDFTDQELETLLREGTHPERDIYLMPSRNSQFLSDADMRALIAFLRTIEPTGQATPPPPPGFEEAVVARLPDDGWRIGEYGRKFYPNAQEEVQFYRKYRAAAVGQDYERGRYIAAAACSSCHGPGLDGYGEDAGSIIDLSRPELEADWGKSHPFDSLTASEAEAVKAYVGELASRSNKADRSP